MAEPAPPAGPTSGADLDALRVVVRSVAHELNNRLQVVSLSSTFVERAADAETAGALVDLRTAADGALRLVRQLEGLVSDRADDGPTDLSLAVQTVTGVIQHALLRRGASLRVELAPDAPRVALPRVELSWLVLRVLLDVVPSPCRGAVRLAAGRQGPREAYVELQVPTSAAPALPEALTLLAQRAGGRLEARGVGVETITRLILPAAERA